MMNKQQILKYIGVLLIGILAGIYIISAFKSGPDMSLYKYKLDSLSTVITANNKKQLLQDIKISNFEIKINKLDSQNVVYETKINKLNANKNAKLKAVDNFTNDSLFKSVSSRYK